MRRTLFATAILTLTYAGSAIAQGRGSSGWSTAGGDPQRTAWVRTDPQISKEAIGKGVMQFLWKTKLDNTPRQLEALTPPAVTGRVITYKGFKDLMFISGSSDKVWSIDHPLGKIFWETQLPYAATYPQQKGGSAACPGGLTSVVAMGVGGGNPAGAAPPAGGRGPDAGRGGRGGRGGGRGDATPPAGAPGAAAPAASAPGPPPGPRLPAAVYALSSDGLIHTLNQHSGGDIAPAFKFIRPNALARGLAVVDNIAYVATTGGCGGTPNGVWAMDLTANVKELSTVKWLSGTANIEGSGGFTFGAPGTVYTATGDGAYDPANGEFGKAVVALDQKTLKLKDWFTGDTAFRTAPVFFNYKDKDYLTVADQTGRLYLLDAASLGGSAHKTPLFVSAPGKSISGALASWQDADGTRWILAAAANAIVAHKLAEQNGKVALQPGWTSIDLVSPAAPIIVNGVVFALSTGENTVVPRAQRAQRSAPAVLYALDGATGKELWNSGKTITAFSHSGGLASGASKVFVSTPDGTLYAFGYLLNRD